MAMMLTPAHMNLPTLSERASARIAALLIGGATFLGSAVLPGASISSGSGRTPTMTIERGSEQTRSAPS